MKIFHFRLAVIGIAILTLAMQRSEAAQPSSNREPLPELAPLDIDRYLAPDRLDFTPTELEFGVLETLVGLADAVNRMPAEGPHRGWTRIPSRNDEPYNARNQEALLIYAYYLAADRPWNPYFKDPVLLARFEAGLDYWASLQEPGGGFSQWKPNGDNVTVASMTLGALLPAYQVVTQAGIELDRGVERRFRAAVDKAIALIIRENTSRNNVANQQIEGVDALACYIDMFNRHDLKPEIDRQIENLVNRGQSPIGYYYEARASGLAYGFYVSEKMTRRLFERTADPRILAAHQRFYDFMSYNLLLEPREYRNGGEREYLANRSISSRMGLAHFGELRRPWANKIELAAAYAMNPDDLLTRQQLLSDLRDASPSELFKIGGSYGFEPIGWRRPMIFKNMLEFDYHWPDAAASKAAVKRIPYLAESRFTRLFVDAGRWPATFLYVRRPSYFFSFFGGPARRNQRFGPASIWHPTVGAIAWSARQDDDAWGTRASGKYLETSEPEATYLEGRGNAIPTDKSGIHDVDAAGLTYTASEGEMPRKALRFSENMIRIEVSHKRPFREQLPLLVHEDDRLHIDDSSASGVTLDYIVGDGQTAYQLTIRGASRHGWSDAGRMVANKRLRVLSLESEGKLVYIFDFRQR